MGKRSWKGGKEPEGVSELRFVSGGSVVAFVGETMREDVGDGPALRVAGDVSFSGDGGLEEEEGFHVSPVRSSIVRKELRPSLEVMLLK